MRRAATTGGSSSRRCTLGRQEAMDLGADRNTGLAGERNKVGDEASKTRSVGTLGDIKRLEQLCSQYGFQTSL